jgi:hypothetical protein
MGRHWCKRMPPNSHQPCSFLPFPRSRVLDSAPGQLRACGSLIDCPNWELAKKHAWRRRQNRSLCPGGAHGAMRASSGHNELWRQWSEKWGWVSMGAGAAHSEMILVLAAVVLVNFALVLVVGVWWLLSARTPGFPHRRFAAWFALLSVSAMSYFPSSQQYAAAAVLLFGPRSKITGISDSCGGARLDRAARRADPEGSLSGQGYALRRSAVRQPACINRLVERSVPVNAECNARKTAALHEAVAAKQHRSAEILVKAGAKADLSDVKGSTPLDVARRQVDDRMIGILTQNGQSRP